MFEALIDKFKALSEIDENETIHGILERQELQEEIVQLNKQQLLDGRAADNSSLPRYEDDSFFKTQKAAKAYEAWKSKISPNKSKPVGVMDFYINGKFHDTIKMKNNTDSFLLTSDSEIASDVQSKTGNEAFGLSDISLGKIIPKLKDYIIETIKNKIAA